MVWHYQTRFHSRVLYFSLLISTIPRPIMWGPLESWPFNKDQLTWGVTQPFYFIRLRNSIGNEGAVSCYQKLEGFKEIIERQRCKCQVLFFFSCWSICSCGFIILSEYFGSRHADDGARSLFSFPSLIPTDDGLIKKFQDRSHISKSCHASSPFRDPFLLIASWTSYFWKWQYDSFFGNCDPQSIQFFLPKTLTVFNFKKLKFCLTSWKMSIQSKSFVVSSSEFLSFGTSNFAHHWWAFALEVPFSSLTVRDETKKSRL